jgi:uncharacterized protein (TIGR02246 family)
MSMHQLSRSTILFLGGGVIAATMLVFVANHVGSAGQSPKTKATQASDERQTDRAAIQKSLDSFVAAFHKGDGKAVAAHWAATGEYISDDGTTFSGRPALEKAYSEFFSKNPDNSLEVEIDQFRFPSRDTAVVEGHFKLQKGKKESVVSRCSFLYAREDGKWLIAIAREWPGEGLSIRDLEWLIGTWEAKRDGMVASTKYEWTTSKSFIRCQFSIVQDGQTYTGMQMFGKDPSTGLLRVWTFEDSGGIGDADITRDGKKWNYAARGVTSEGGVLAATNIITPIDSDTFLWQSVNRTMNDEAQPDLPPIKVTRVKSK